MSVFHGRRPCGWRICALCGWYAVLPTWPVTCRTCCGAIIPALLAPSVIFLSNTCRQLLTMSWRRVTPPRHHYSRRSLFAPRRISVLCVDLPTASPVAIACHGVTTLFCYNLNCLLRRLPTTRCTVIALPNVLSCRRRCAVASRNNRDQRYVLAWLTLLT